MSALASVARFAHRRRWPVIACFAVLLAAALAYGIGASGALTRGGFENPASESERASRMLERTFGAGSPDVVVVYSAAAPIARDPELAGRVRRVAEALSERPEVEDLATPFGSADPFASAPSPHALVSRDGRALAMRFRLAGSQREEREALARITPILRVEGLTSWIGGRVPTELETQRAAGRDLMRGDMVALPIIAILLVVFFRGVVAASLPLLVAGFAVGASLSALRLIAGVTDLSLFAVNIVTFLGLGIAVDYSLFITSRFREELAATRDVALAVERTAATAGRTIAYSGITVAGSMLGLFAFPNVLLRSVAISGLLVVISALVASLLFLPAVLAALGPRIEWLRIGRAGVPRESGLWRRLAGLVQRAPVPVVALTTAFLLVLGAPFLRFHASVGGAAVLPAGSEGRKVAEILESDRFASNELQPIVIAVTTDDDVLTRDGLRALERYANRIAALDGVERVDAIAGGSSHRSISTVLAARGALSAVARGRRTAVRVVARGDPGSGEQLDLVARIRAISTPGIEEALVGGLAAGRADLRASIAEPLPIALTVIAVVTFVLLFVAFGSIAMPIKAIVMNVLSLTAGFGALVLIFQDGRFEGLLRFESPGAVDLMVPVAMFPVLFGLAMDYELFLLSRIREEYERVGDTAGSVRFGLERSGSVITRAALILIAAMLGLVTADMLLIKELGLGTAIAIAVDVTVVRGLLVPATMELLGRYNFWAPGPLARIGERFRIGMQERSRGDGASPS